MTKLQDPSWDAFQLAFYQQQNRKLRDACKVAQMALLGFIPKERNEVVSNALRVLEAVITPAWGAKACWFETEAQAIAKAGGEL